MHAFNDFFADYELRELFRGGSKYTWTNKQIRPVRCSLDRVLVNDGWEQHFPLAKSWF